MEDAYQKYVSNWKDLRILKVYSYMGHNVVVRLRDIEWEFLFAHNDEIFSSLFRIEKSGDRNRKSKPYTEKELNDSLNFVMAHANNAVETEVRKTKVGKLQVIINKLLFKNEKQKETIGTRAGE